MFVHHFSHSNQISWHFPVERAPSMRQARSNPFKWTENDNNGENRGGGPPFRKSTGAFNRQSTNHLKFCINAASMASSQPDLHASISIQLRWNDTYSLFALRPVHVCAIMIKLSSLVRSASTASSNTTFLHYTFPVRSVLRLSDCFMAPTIVFWPTKFKAQFRTKPMERERERMEFHFGAAFMERFPSNDNRQHERTTKTKQIG